MSTAAFPSTSLPLPESLGDAPVARAASIGLAIHDASHLEWSVTLPLVALRTRAYEIAIEIEVPANIFVPHRPWDQLQSFSRLDGPDDGASHEASIEALRRSVVALTAKLTRAAEGFARHCRAVADPAEAPAADELSRTLLLWLDVALRSAADARGRVIQGAEDEPAHLVRERELADEYLSLELTKLLADAARALCAARESPSAHAEGFASAFDAVEGRIVDAFEAEVAHRRERRFLHTDPTSPAALERYLERARLLEKHFREVLFLKTETLQTNQRTLHWISAIAALLAATIAFFLQLVLASRAKEASSTIGSGIFIFALIAGIAYAVRDRFKDIGRDWISEKLCRFYGQRVTRYCLPERLAAKRSLVVSARESFGVQTVARPDPLNPESGASAPVTVLRFLHKGSVWPQARLARPGMPHVEHVFRYDLSPLFVRLHDGVKPVAVVDREAHRVRFTEASRCYRVPVRARLTCAGQSYEESATLVLYKRGLARLDPGLA
jgi:hypothetical protein